jgi:hypothetical protein
MDPSAPPNLPQPPAAISAGILALVFVAMAAWSWGAWPDATVDFGRELYLVWRVSEGDVLYRDLPYFDGPLSLLLNGALARVAGMSLLALVAKNLAVAALVTAALFRIMERIADRAAALAGGVVFLTTFAFARLLDVGNYNFITPYTHLATDGIALTLAALLALERMLAGRWRWGFALGLAAGAAFLGKADYFAAMAVALGGGIAAAWWTMPSHRPDLRRGALAACATAPVAPLLCLAWFARELSAAGAARAVLGSWPHVLGGASSLPFYRGVLGIDDVAGNLAKLAASTAAWGGVLGAMSGAYRMLRVPAERAPLASAVLFIAPLAALSVVSWPDAFRPLPLAMAALAAVCAWRLRSVRGTQWAPRASLRLAFVLWGLALLAKVALNAKLRHYGFGLAMPGTLALVALAVCWMPRQLGDRALPATSGRALGLGVTAAVVLAHLLVSAHWYGAATTPVGSGADRFRSEAPAAAISQAVEWLERERPGRTLASFPDGAMLNYLARRVNPSGQTLAVPTAIGLIGEERIIADLEARPPDLVAVVAKDTSDEGARDFGTDYAQQLSAWIRANYRGVAQFDGGSGFWIIIMERQR